MQDAYSVKTFCDSHGISRGAFYNAHRAGTGPRTFKLGARTLISRESAEAWRRTREVLSSRGAFGNGGSRGAPHAASSLEGPGTPTSLNLSSQWCQLWLPYVIARVADSKGGNCAYLLLNRFYKPLGLCARGWVRYEDFNERFIKFKTAPTYLSMWWSQNPHQGKFYLYSDDVESWTGYTARLAQMLRNVRTGK